MERKEGRTGGEKLSVITPNSEVLIIFVSNYII